ncbi:hypothetical protein R6Q57_019581 [Mikania cordata]
MKEHTDDVLLSVKESTPAVDSTSIDEIVTRRGKIEGIFGERDEKDDMMDDVVSADAGVDNHGVTNIDLAERVTREQVIEDVSVVKKVSDDLVESRVVTLEKVELVKELIQEKVVTTVGNGSDCDDQKSGNGSVEKDSTMAEPSKPSNKEPEAGGEETEVSESVRILADGDHVVEEETHEKTEVLSSSKIQKSIAGCVVEVEEGLFSQDKAEDVANNQSLLTEVVDGGTGGDNAYVSAENTENQAGVDQTNIEIQLTNEAKRNDAKKSGIGESNMIVESMNAEPQISMKDVCVMNEKTVEDEALDSTKISESLTIVNEVVDHGNAENLNKKDGVDQTSEEESSQSTIEVRTDDASKSEDSKMDDEPHIIKGELAVKHENEDLERCLTKEMEEQPTESVQEATEEDHVMNEKTVEDDVLNLSKISQSLTMASLGLEDVDVVVVDESLEGKNEAQDGVSVELSLVCPDNQSLSTEIDLQTEVDQEVGVDLTCKDGNLHATTVAHKEPDSDVQVLTDGGVLVENQSIKDNDVTNSSKPDVVAYTEPESFNDKMIPGVANEVVETNIGVQTSKVEPATIGCNSSNFQDNQGLIVSPNKGNEITSSHITVPDSAAGVPTGEPQTYGEHGVIPANSEFSYEEAHMDRAEDAGMDIDEVLGWKDETHSEDGSKKRKALDSVSDDLEKQPTLQTETLEAKPSFKVGAVIQKLASQPTGPQLMGEQADHVAKDPASVQSLGPNQMGNQAGMLSELYLAAQDPMKGYSFMNTIIPFFKSHRAAVLSKSRKRKTSNENEPDEFEFDDVNDSYWTDRIIQNQPEEQVLQGNPTGGGELQIVAYEQEKPPVKPARRSNKKRFFSSNHEIEANEQSEIIVRRQQNLATEVLMKFAGGIYFPSEIHLNKMFRRFGPLMESETEVDRQSGRARVVFKKCSDAEVAHSSAGKFNIFGSISVNYELNYTPLISYKPLPLPVSQDPTC